MIKEHSLVVLDCEPPNEKLSRVGRRRRGGDSSRFTGFDAAPLRGYTFGMKTAVSIPDDVFEDAERLASKLQTSRSKLYARALAEFVARHDDDRVTALMDEAVREAGGQRDTFVAAAARQSMQRVEW